MSSRPFKFRVWDNLGYKMYYPNGELIGWNDEWDYPEIHQSFRTRDYGYNLCKEGFKGTGAALILQQFIGFHDKNGREIYEGDIIGLNLIKYLIIWDGLSYFGIDLHVGEKYTLDIENLKFFEVIGNRFENPEMIDYE